MSGILITLIVSMGISAFNAISSPVSRHLMYTPQTALIEAVVCSSKTGSHVVPLFTDLKTPPTA